jgi:hypothetical protein
MARQSRRGTAKADSDLVSGVADGTPRRSSFECQSPLKQKPVVKLAPVPRAAFAAKVKFQLLFMARELVPFQLRSTPESFAEF